MQSADHEFADGNRGTFGEEWLDTQIRIDSGHLRVIDGAVGIPGDAAVLDPLAQKLQGHGSLSLLSLRDGQGSGVTQVGGDLVGQHLLEPQSKKMWRVAAIGMGRNVPARSRRASRAT